MCFLRLFILLCCFSGSLLAQVPSSSSSPSVNKEIFKLAEQMPSFPYTEADCPSGVRRNCGQAALKKYLADNLRYPSLARRNGVEGTVVISFIVETDGRLSDIKILRDIGANTGKEAVRLIEQMNERGIRWLPGQQRDQLVRVQYNLPVKFRMENIEADPVATVKTAGAKDSIYKKVDLAPLFPGSQTNCGKQPQECSTATMLDYVYNNVDYPDSASYKGISGMSVVSFVVEKDGSMSDLQIVRDPGGGLGKEALRVVRSIADRSMRWTPGQVDGEAVRTRFNLPIKFALSKAQTKAAKKRAKRARKN